MAGRRKIFDGEHIYVDYDEVSQDSVVFSFSGFEAMSTLARPGYADGFIQKTGRSGAFFVAKQSHWWQTQELQEAIDAANAATAHIQDRIAYGHSMGGYGALLSAGRLNSRSIVTAPQTTVAETAPFRSEWREKMRGFQCLQDNVNEEISRSRRASIIFDPRDRTDIVHFRHIARNTKVSSYVVPFSTHAAPRSLTEMGVFSTLISSMMSDASYSVKDARRLVRDARSKSPQYIQSMTRRLNRRKSKWLSIFALKAIESKRVEHLNLGLPSDHLSEALNAIAA